MINFLLILLFIVIVIYLWASASVVNIISDMMLLDQLTLWESISRLSLPRKTMLILGFPITVPLGILIFVINLIFYFKTLK